MDNCKEIDGVAPDESVIEKIRKLLALADGNRNQNEHEREVAMQFAMDLLAKHNLSMAHVSETEFIADINVEEVRGDFKLDPWIRVVLSAACKLYYTDFYISVHRKHYRDYYGEVRARNERTAVFVGTAENIAVTIDVATWLIGSIRKESNRIYKDEFERRSFRLGAAHRVIERAFEMMELEKRSSAAAAGTGTSLMVLRNQLEKANQKHMAKLDLAMGRRTRTTWLDMAAYTDGEAYGDQVRLNQQSANIRGRLAQSSAKP